MPHLKFFGSIFILIAFICFSQAATAQKANRSASSNEAVMSLGESQAIRSLLPTALQNKRNGISDNDAGIISQRAASYLETPEAICTTWTFSITAADLPMTSRPNRDGVVKTCAAPATCTNAPVAGTFAYRINQWVCPVNQCVTVTYNATNANFSFVTVYNQPPNLSALCTNWVTDAGSSATVGTPQIFSFNGVAGTTYYFLINNATSSAFPADGTVQIDANVCSSTPCSGAPVVGNTTASVNPVGPGVPFTLSTSSTPNFSGINHYWQSAPSGTGPWTTFATTPGNSTTTNILSNTWFRDSAVCTNGNAFAIATPLLVTVLPCGWTAGPTLPINMMDQASVRLNNNLYTFTAVSNNAVVANSYRFDGTTWTAIAAYPVAVEYPAAVTDGTNIYIMGGASGTTGTPQTTMYRYNVAANTYTQLASFTVGTWNHAAAYLNGKIYKIAGTGPATASSKVVEIYDVASNTWSRGADYPDLTSFISAVTVGNFVYAAGGINAGANVASAKTYRYDPSTDTWDDAAIADLPGNRWGSAGTLYGPYPNYGTFVMAGGYITNSTVISNTVLDWNPTTNTWGTSIPNMTGQRSRMTGGNVGNSFYVVGGRDVGNFVGTNTNQKLTCSFPACTGTPTPGNTIGPSLICTGVSFTLFLQNVPSVTGFTFQWQTSPDGTNWTNIPGATAGTLTTSITGTTWYRAQVSCGANTGTSTPLQIRSGQGVFTSQPVSATTQCGQNATFTVNATGLNLTWLWEFRPNASSPWQLVQNGGVYSGATTNVLTLTNVPSTLNGYQYRAVMQGSCTAPDFSNAVTLTVNPLVTTVTPTSANICAGQIQQLRITNNVGGTATASFTSGPLNFSIPDNVATASTFTIPVSGIPVGSVILDVRIHLNMTHTYPADMVINLKGTHASNILSLYKHNTNTDNGAVSIPTAGFFNAVCSQVGTTQWRAVPTPFRYGITPPTGPFAADALNAVTNPGYTIMDPTGWASNATTWGSLINAGDANGTWTLAMCDGGPADLGVFTGWTIDIDYAAAQSAQGIWTSTPAAPNTMFTDPAATIAYTGTPASTIYVKPTVNTTYCVSFTTSTPCTSTQACIPVNVFTPVAGLAVTPASPAVCVGNNTTLTATATGGPISWQWQVSVDGGVTWTNIAGATSNTLPLNSVTPQMNNNRYRVVASAAACSSNPTSNVVVLKVNLLPKVTVSSPTLQIVPGGQTTITASSDSTVAPTNYTWFLNGGQIIGANTNSVVANIDKLGNYSASVIDANGCVGISNVLVIGGLASDRLWIYPNPSNDGRFQVRMFYDGDKMVKRKIKIYTMDGRKVAEKSFNLTYTSSPYMQMDFDLRNLPNGSYVVRVDEQYLLATDKDKKQEKSGILVIHR